MAAVTDLASGQATGWIQPLAEVKAHCSWDPSLAETSQLDPVFQTNRTPHSRLHPRISAHVSHSCRKDQAPPPQ